MPRSLPKKHLLDVYRTSERHERRDGFVCLDRNERLSPIDDAVLAEMLSSITSRDLTSYPDAGPFVARLAAQCGVPEDRIAETAGSDAALRRIFMAYLRPGRAVVFPNPSYAMYPIYTRIFEGISRPIDYGADRTLDLEQLLAAITPDVDVVVVANPDQPMGTAVAPATLHQIIARASDMGALCVVDEAYFPFHPETIVEMVEQCDNLIVTRTLSKYPGVAGLRLGYAVAKPTLIRGLMSVRGGNEVSGVSFALGCYLLDHGSIGEDFRISAEAGRSLLIDGARRLGFGAPPCVANFQLIRCAPGVQAKDVALALQHRGYLVKSGFAHPALKDCLRVTLNDPDIMAQFLIALENALGDVVGGHPAGGSPGR